MASSVPLRAVAKQHGVSLAAVQRHSSEHIKQAVEASKAAKSEASALDVVAQLKATNATTLAILEEAREAHDSELALRAIARIEKQIELQARLLGQLPASQSQAEGGLTLKIEWTKDWRRLGHVNERVVDAEPDHDPDPEQAVKPRQEPASVSRQPRLVDEIASYRTTPPAPAQRAGETVEDRPTQSAQVERIERELAALRAQQAQPAPSPEPHTERERDLATGVIVGRANGPNAWESLGSFEQRGQPANRWPPSTPDGRYSNT